VTELEAQRHALEKGTLLKALQTEYAGAPVIVRTLRGAMDELGFPMSDEGIQFALQYLSDQGYVIPTRVRDLPNWREDRPDPRRPDSFVTVKLSALGLRLVDGKCPSDPMVKF
jgi:hypothetical protein